MTKTDIHNLTLGALGVLGAVIYNTGLEDAPWWANLLTLILMVSGFYLIHVATREDPKNWTED